MSEARERGGPRRPAARCRGRCRTASTPGVRGSPTRPAPDRRGTGRAGRGRAGRARAPAGARSTGSSQAFSSRNQRSRSGYGTTAFAGDVEGSTNSPTSASVRRCAPSSGRSPKTPRYASLPTNAIARGRRSTASCRSRSADPAKSPRRRSPEPGVVRSAAFVRPIPSSGRSNCSSGSYSRGVNPASPRSRQKSLRGLAKWARAAAETRPGLIPQKTTRSPGPRTSGTALGLPAARPPRAAARRPAAHRAAGTPTPRSKTRTARSPPQRTHEQDQPTRTRIAKRPPASARRSSSSGRKRVCTRRRRTKSSRGIRPVSASWPTTQRLAKVRIRTRRNESGPRARTRGGAAGSPRCGAGEFSPDRADAEAGRRRDRRSR